MKTKIIFLFFMVFALAFSGESLCKEMIRGTVITTPQNKISVGVGEKIITNLGKNYGVIVGDIFSVVESDDDDLIGHIGRCAVTRVDDAKSVCEVIRLSAEVGKGDYVYIDKLEYSDPQLYLSAFTLLNEAVSNYQPYDIINVYVNDIVDDKNNISKLSVKIKEEIASIFEQKKRIFVSTTKMKYYMNYPDHYFNPDKANFNKQAIEKLKNSMRNTNIDVAITGFYSKKGDFIDLILYVIDKNNYDKVIKSTLNVKDYSSSISEIVLPYKPFQEKEFVKYSVVYRNKDYLPDSDEQREIIKNESNKELHFKYKFIDSKVKFNRISPGDLYIKVNEEEIDGTQQGIISEKYFEKGIKRIMVSFVPTLLNNYDEIIQLKKEVKKEIILDLKDENNIKIDIVLDSTYNKEKIDIKIVRETVREPFIIKPIISEIDKKPAIDIIRD